MGEASDGIDARWVDWIDSMQESTWPSLQVMKSSDSWLN